MKFKDGLSVLLFWLMVDMFLVVAMDMNNPFLWVVWIISAFVWASYTWVTLTRKQPIMWLEVQGRWRAIDSTGNLIPLEKTPPMPLDRRENYQQEEDSL